MVLTASFPKPDPTAFIGAVQTEAAISCLPGCVALIIMSTKLAKPLQTEGLEEQLEEMLRGRHNHKIGN